MKRLRIRRKRERWVSKSKELHGASANEPGRNPNFDNDETKLLISLWGDPLFQKTLITTHRKHKVIVQLAEQMNEYGYKRTPGEINTRIKNLKCFYNRLKKDIDAGSVGQVSWKHFNAMDEIMTRSIFSVRPDEIPKPSRTYQIEMAKTEKEELNNCKAANSHSNSSDTILKSEVLSDDDDVQILNTDNESPIMECSKQIESATVKIELEEVLHTNTEMQEDNLLIPKEEHLDEIDEVHTVINQKNKSPDSHAPILSEYIQVPNSSSTPGSHFTNTSKSTNSNLNNLMKTAQASTTVPQSIVFTNPPSNGISSQGKISLVPTNFLLQQKSKPQPIQIRPQPQQRIICAQPKNPTNTGIVSSANNGRMKVLFVNAFQNGSSGNVSATKEFPINNQNLINNSNTIQTEPSVSMNYIENPKPSRVDETDVNIKDHGFELLFNKLIEMQHENNEIQRQHLDLARQRLEFEKSMANKFLEVLTSLKPDKTKDSTNISNLRKRSANPEDLNNEKSIIPDIIDEFPNYHLLTPKIEKID